MSKISASIMKGVIGEHMSDNVQTEGMLDKGELTKETMLDVTEVGQMGEVLD